MSAWLTHLSEVFRADPLIDEYEVLPAVSSALFGAPDGDASDRGCLCMEHKLAISAEAALVIYRHAHKAMVSARSATGSTADEAAGFQALEAASRAVLLCSADCAGAWTCREELLRADVVSAESELRFSTLVLRTNHKSGEAWAFRRHLLSGSLGALPSEDALKVLSMEVSFVEEVAKRYEHHYYAWNHWAWLQRAGGPLGRGLAQGFPELVHATPSHYGPFHHRVVRLRELLSPPSAGQDTLRAACLLQDELGESAVSHHGEGQGEPGESSAQRLSLAPSGLEAYASERRLAASLLATLPHLEAPWAFLLQLFAALLDAADIAGDGRPSATAVGSLADVWRSEMAFASDHLGSDQGVVRSFALRFQAHLLQELSLSLRFWLGAPTAAAPPAGGAQVPRLACGPKLVAEALATLGALEAERAAAPAVLASVRRDLTRLGAAA